MHDALRMCSVQSIGHLHSQIEDFLDIQRLAPNQVLERLSLQQLHGDEGPAVSFVDLVDCADVWMIQRRCSKGFPLEAFASGRIPGQLFRQKLQGHMAAQLEVFRFVDHTHAAATKLFQDAVVGDGLPDHG